MTKQQTWLHPSVTQNIHLLYLQHSNAHKWTVVIHLGYSNDNPAPKLISPTTKDKDFCRREHYHLHVIFQVAHWQ